MAHTDNDVAAEDLESVPVERRAVERRRRSIPVTDDRRQSDRRAHRLSPAQVFAGVAVVVDSWPLLRAGVGHLLRESAMRVAAEVDAAASAAREIGDRLDLAVIGDVREPLADAVKLMRGLPGAGPDGRPKVLVLMDRVDIGELRDLLSMGVEGVVDRSVNQTDLRAACERVLNGHRVLAGSPLALLAASGLEPAAPTPVVREESLLTRKELEVLAELAKHNSNREIAEAMHVSAATVKTHLSHIYAKLAVSGRREAVLAAVERGLLA